MKTMTIAEAIGFLSRARDRLGADNACLVLSLTDSGIEDAGVNGMTLVEDSDGTRYVQVEVSHPAFVRDVYRGLPRVSAERALRMLVDAINAIGGLVRGELPGELVPAGDERWLDLAHAYLAACEALGVKPAVQGAPRGEPLPG